MLTRSRSLQIGSIQDVAPVKPAAVPRGRRRALGNITNKRGRPQDASVKHPAKRSSTRAPFLDRAATWSSSAAVPVAVAAVGQEDVDAMDEDDTQDDALDTHTHSQENHTFLPQALHTTATESLPSCGEQMDLDDVSPLVRVPARAVSAVADQWDVDSADLGKPLLEAEYIGDIMRNLRDKEMRHAANPRYMSTQADVNPKMREILVDWLVEVHLKFKLREETLYLTVNLVDRFLSRQQIRRSKLQLLGCTAMLIASKYEEIYCPEVRDFVYIADNAYSRDEILEMEGFMLNVLHFNISVPYSLRFSQRCCKVMAADPSMEQLCYFLLELTLQKYEMVGYRPSELGCAAAFLARKLRGAQAWTPCLEANMRYSEAELLPCVRAMYTILAGAPGKYKAVRRKYSHAKMLSVAADLDLSIPLQL